MTNRRVGAVHSLRTQLLVGAILLLAVTVTAVGYFLILHQQRVLTAEMEKTVILQGRNIALSSQKFLLRDDPEFELFPLVTRILEGTPRVESIVIVDDQGVIQGHEDLVQVSKQYTPDLQSYAKAGIEPLRPGESMYENDDFYLFITPVSSADHDIGAVYLGYSKQDLYAGIRNAFRITLMVSIAALLVSVVVSFLFFRHISRPMSVMLEGVDALGGGNLEAQIEMPTRNEFRILADAFNDMSQRIATAQNELISKERMERELELAHEIQQSLLPGTVTPPAGFEISHYDQSANEVGGDYVDVVPIDDGRVALAMADVSGKGVPGLVIMAMVKTLIQELLRTYSSPRDIVCGLNAALQGNIKANMFVTFFVGILDGGAGRLTMSNAGHNPVVVHNQATGETRLMKMGGPPLGPFPPEVFNDKVEAYTLDLRPGDVALQYTDGLNESRNLEGHQFGIARIVSLADANATDGAEALVRKLVAAEAKFRGEAGQSDDITMLAVSALTNERAAAPGQTETPGRVVAETRVD